MTPYLGVWAGEGLAALTSASGVATALRVEAASGVVTASGDYVTSATPVSVNVASRFAHQ
jgi:hypothetical protein